MRLRACAAALLLVVPAWSENAALEALVEGARTAMSDQDWAWALDFNTRAIQSGGDDPLATFGPQFGTIHYRKGLCEIKLKRWDDAMRSFEICYRDFPNDETTGGNPFEKMALLKWGEAAMGAEKWALAASCFTKFLGERDRVRDTFPQGAFYVNLAICQYRLGWIAEGNENLEIAIRNKENFPTPEVVVIAGFQALVGAALETRNEQALLDFIKMNRGGLVIAPFAMARYSPVFMKLAGDALDARLHRAALAIYQFVPSTAVAIDDTRARLKALGGADETNDGTTVLSKAQLEQDLAALEAERRGSRPPEAVKLAALAFLHESLGNFRDAFAAYQQLELSYPNADGREDRLFQLVRISSRLGPAAGTRTHAEKFITDFPQSEMLDSVRQLLISSIYESGDYAAVIAVAAPLLKLFKSGSPEHDYCLHVLGAAYYHAGRHEEAGPLLDRHVEEYPASGSAQAAAFYQASNAARLGSSTSAAALLDRFLAAHPDAATNPFLPAALYDRAAGAEPDAALEMIGHILREFPASPVIGRTYQLKGAVEETQGKTADAAKSYRHALKLAQKSGEPQLVGEILYALVRLSADTELFQQFKTEFAVDDLSSAYLLKIGDYLRSQTSTPREALVYYDEVVRRADPAAMHAAMLGRGDVFGRSTAAAELARALEDMTRVISASEVRGEVDYASYRRIELLVASGRHEEAIAQAKSYLATGFPDFISPVRLLLAQLYHQREMSFEAISHYEELWTTRAQDISISAPAMAGWMVLSAKDPAARRQVYARALAYLAETEESAKEVDGSALSAREEVERLTKELQGKGD